MKKTRSKYYGLELYEKSDNLQFDKVIKIVQKYEHAYILHDKDNAKKHYHVVLMFDNYRYIDSVCEELGIPNNYIEAIRSIDGMLTYLIHLNQKNKYQYSIDEVQGTSLALDKFKKALKNNGLEEEQKVIELIDYIQKEEYLTFTRFVKYSCSIGRYDIVRRSQYLFVKMIEEHNKHIMEIVDDIKLSWYN